MKRLCRPVILAVIAVLLIATPALAMYYAYIYIEESDGNSYTSLPLMVSANVSQLVAGKYITSTGLDTRVLTGDGYSLPHMLTNDKILFVSDLEAYEDKTLIFYTGASALSGFPIIVGQGGNVTTDDDASMEPSWVFEMLTSGYFDASAGSDKNIAYKEDAYRAWISGEDTLRVAALEAGGGEQWALEDTGFDSGTHTVYTVADGLAAYLYVDDMDVAKDTANLFDSDVALFNDGYDGRFPPYARRTFYANGRFWAFYSIGGSWFGQIYYRTSTDGESWTAETGIGIASGTDFEYFSVWFDGTHFHVAYGESGLTSEDNSVWYRSGTPNSDGSITWRDVWQGVWTENGDFHQSVIATDADGYPWIRYSVQTGTFNYRYRIIKSSTNTGTWAMAAGYPMDSISFQAGPLVGYPNSNKMYLMNFQQSPSRLAGRYYNGVSWSGTEDVWDATYSSCTLGQCNIIADEDDNLVAVWRDGTWATCGVINLRIRYANGTFSDTIEVVSSGGKSPTVSYDTVTGAFYIFYTKDDTSIYVRALNLDEATFSGEYLIGTPTELNQITATAYGHHIGVLSVGYVDNTDHTTFRFPWVWNDNANDWHWMQNDVTPYASYLMWGVDGELVMHYQPNTIVQSATLPDRSTGGNDNPGTINWGSNPDGVDVSISGLLTDETEDQYDYAPYIDMGGQDIIKPDPAALTGDIDMAKLERNPFRPLALAIAEIGDFSERLAWLGMGWLALIIAMLIVHLGIESRPGERPQPGEQPQHFILTALTGLGLSIIFYITGVFPLWPVIVLAFGFIASIVYERMPVL